MHFLERLTLILAAFEILTTTVIDNTIHASAELSPTLSKPITIRATYNTLYEYYVNASAEYVFYYKSSGIGVLDGARIHVQSDNATFEYPIIVVVRQKKGILAWQVPTLVQGRDVIDPFQYRNTSRNLCPSKYNEVMNYYQGRSEHVAISIATASRYNISFHLELKLVRDFYVNPGESRTFNVTPSEPVYFGYDFAKSKDERSVLVKVSSESQVCMTFSIDNTTCPVFGYDGNTKRAGYWQTVSLQGGITVPKAAYPHGFFIVFLINPDDHECSGNSTFIHNRQKTVRLTIDYDIGKDNYILALVTVASAFIGFCIAYVIGILCYKLHRPVAPGPQVADNPFDETDHGVNSASATSSITESHDYSSAITNPNNIAAAIVTDEYTNSQNAQSRNASSEHLLTQDDVDVEHQYRDLCLSDLIPDGVNVLCNKSHLYLKYIATIAIFYTAPVAQLVITNQWQVHETGNGDLCFYNFQCSHPVFFLSDFNHVFSNLGYVMLGLLFMFVVYTRKRYNNFSLQEIGHGIPQHYGLYYAMGFALMMEGVLSACYHVCPNRSNFQFDTSFMYIIAVLCMVKLYQNRHPGIHAGAPVTFGVLAHTILIALTGILVNAPHVWILFTIVHFIFCVYLSFRIYYMSSINVDLTLLLQKFKTIMNDVYLILKLRSRPLYTKRLILLLIANLCNIGLAIYGNYRAQDFGTYLLMVLMSNLILYTFLYIIMKHWHKETILLQPVIYIILAASFWGGSLYFFVANATSWTTTASQSRNHNQPCFPWLFYFYDSHDVWHFLSSIAIFFSFMTLLTLDDDLVSVDRSKIHVF